MTPTKEQLADPAWWSENAPGSATHAHAIEGGVDFYKREDGIWLYLDEHNSWSRAYMLNEAYCVPRPESAKWTGPQDGLPPVGIECEVAAPGFNHPRFNRFIGQKVFVIAHDVVDGTPVAVFRMPVDGDPLEQDYHSMVAAAFRPIETPEQKAARARTEAIEHMRERFAIYDIPNVPWQNLFAQMYDAGLRFTEKP